MWILEGLTKGKADFTLLGEGRGTLKFLTGSKMVEGMIKVCEEVSKCLTTNEELMNGHVFSGIPWVWEEPRNEN